MKSFELKTKIRKLYYDNNEETQDFIGFYIDDDGKMKENRAWFDENNSIDYIQGFLEIKYYGQIWLDANQFWSYPIHQWTIGGLGYLPTLEKIIKGGIDFYIQFHSEKFNIFFDSINEREYLLYIAYKYIDLEEALEVGLYDSKTEYDSIPKLYPILVQKKDVYEEIVNEGIKVFKMLLKYDNIANKQKNEAYLYVFEYLKKEYLFSFD